MADNPQEWCTPTPPPDPPPLPPGRTKLAPITPSSLCSMGWRPILITGLIRDILIRHFQTPLNIEEPDLRHLVWRQDDLTGILIESYYRWRGDLVEKRPAIIIKQNARQNVRKAIADRGVTTEQGMTRYTTFWAGSHTCFCIHGSGAGVEILATEVQREMTQFGPPLVEYLGLLRWQVTEVGAIAELEEAKETFVIPVTLAWVYQEIWQVNKASLKLSGRSLRDLLGDALV